MEGRPHPPPAAAGNSRSGCASLPLALGGLGLRSASRTHPSAYWASWADSLHMVQKRHPGVAGHLLTHLEGVPVGQSLTSATTAGSLDGVHGFEVPSWRSLAAGARPPLRDPEDCEPGSPRQGWQHVASSRVEQDFRALDLETHRHPEDDVAIAEWSRSGRVLVHNFLESSDKD